LALMRADIVPRSVAEFGLARARPRAGARFRLRADIRGGNSGEPPVRRLPPPSST